MGSSQNSNEQPVTALPGDSGLPTWPEPDWSAPITRGLVVELERRADIARTRADELRARLEQVQRQTEALQAEAAPLIAQMDTLSDPLLEEAIARQEAVKDDADQRADVAGKRLLRVSRRNTGNQRWLYTMSGNDARREEDEARADLYHLSAHSSMLRKEGQALQEKQNVLLKESDRLMRELAPINVQINRLSREIGQLFELSLQASDMSTYWGDQAMHAREILDWWD